MGGGTQTVSDRIVGGETCRAGSRVLGERWAKRRLAGGKSSRTRSLAHSGSDSPILTSREPFGE
eukprot:1072042-Prymnesium_polylepis.1